MFKHWDRLRGLGTDSHRWQDLKRCSIPIRAVVASGHKRLSSCRRWEVIRLCAWSRAAGTRRAGAASENGSLMCHKHLSTHARKTETASPAGQKSLHPLFLSHNAPEIEPRNDSEAPDAGTSSCVAQRRAEPTGTDTEKAELGNCRQVAAPLLSLHSSFSILMMLFSFLFTLLVRMKGKIRKGST